jgi:hypothetical protein
MHKHTKIDIFIQEIDSCFDCSYAGCDIGPDGHGINHRCDHEEFRDGGKLLPEDMPFGAGIPKWCPLEDLKDVEVNIIKRRKKKKKSYWPKN